MSLATRCIKCGTAFRVVQDQLLVSEGWVRCGRCREVFNAIENMFDLRKDVATSDTLPGALAPDQTKRLAPDRPTASPANQVNLDPPPRAASVPFEPSQAFGASAPRANKPWTSPLRRRTRGRADAAASAPIPRDDPWEGRPTDEVVRSSLWPTSEAPPVTRKRSRRTAALQHDQDFQGSEMTLDVPGDGGPSTGFPSADEVDQLLSSNGRDTTFAPEVPMPDFMVRAKKASQWQHPRVRLALRLSAMVLAFSLLAQWAMHARDTLAARWPFTESSLQTLCVPFDCKVDAPRRLQALQVESASFMETTTPGQYRLAVSLRNQHDLRVKMPALDLQLTDARGQTLARRIITASELGSTAPAIEPQSEWLLQGMVRVGVAAVNGYNVTVFYP